MIINGENRICNTLLLCPVQVEYAANIADDSQCKDHCITFSLSDNKQKEFSKQCQHQHTLTCTECEATRTTLKEAEEFIAEHGDVELQHDTAIAVDHIQVSYL